MNNTLYLIATPIGNLEDITFRALKILLEADVVACEDTRRTGQLIKTYEDKIRDEVWNIRDLHINPKRQLISFYDEIEETKTIEVIEIIKSGRIVALVSDSGTPLIADPGFKLVRDCIRVNINIVSIPGPSAFVSALVSSGIPSNQVLYLGFLPVKEQARIKALTSIKELKIKPTLIIYESPHRINKTLADIGEVFGDIEIVICRELTKVHEEIIRGKVSELVNKTFKGELVILLDLHTPRVN